jgi:hypothetical protein
VAGTSSISIVAEIISAVMGPGGDIACAKAGYRAGVDAVGVENPITADEQGKRDVLKG